MKIRYVWTRTFSANEENIRICVDEALVYPSSKKKFVIFDLILQRFVFIFSFVFLSICFVLFFVGFQFSF